MHERKKWNEIKRKANWKKIGKGKQMVTLNNSKYKNHKSRGHGEFSAPRHQQMRNDREMNKFKTCVKMKLSDHIE